MKWSELFQVMIDYNLANSDEEIEIYHECDGEFSDADLIEFDNGKVYIFSNEVNDE